MDRADKLKIRIVESQAILDFFARRHWHFDEKGYNFLCNELHDLKVELAILESVELKKKFKLIKNN